MISLLEASHWRSAYSARARLGMSKDANLCFRSPAFRSGPPGEGRASCTRPRRRAASRGGGDTERVKSSARQLKPTRGFEPLRNVPLPHLVPHPPASPGGGGYSIEIEDNPM